MKHSYWPVKKSGKKLWKKERKSKHNNRSCKCISGHVHQSRGEAGYCTELELRKRANDIKSYESQKKYVLKIKGVVITTHIPDFLVTLNDGTKEIHEYKGFVTETWRIKKKLFEACYPKLKYIVIWHKTKERRLL